MSDVDLEELKDIEPSLDYLRRSVSKDDLPDNKRKHYNNIITYLEKQKKIQTNINDDYLSFNNFDRLSKKHSISYDDAKFILSEIQINWSPLLSTVFIIGLSSFIFGYCTVESSLIIDASLPLATGALNKKYHLTQFQKDSLIPSSSLIGAAIGSLSMLFYPSLKYGRRTILLLSNIPILIGCILCICSISPTMLIFGFIFEGIGFGISSVIVPILLMEIAPISVRSCITLFHQLFLTIGILTAAIFSLCFIRVDNGWKWIVSLVIIIPIIQLIFHKRIPESPRWLIANFLHRNMDRYDNDPFVDEYLKDKAKDIISRYFVNQNDADVEYEKIYLYIKHNKQLVAMDDTLSNNLEQIGQMADYRRPLFIGMMFNMFQQWTGINFIIYNSQNVLNNAGGYNIYWLVCILYLINVSATIIVVYCARPNGIRNKHMIYIGTIIMLISLALLGIVDLSYDDTGSNQHLIDLLSVAKLAFYIIGFAISLGAYMWIVNCELFPFSHRIRFGSICVFIQWASNAALSLNINHLLKLLEFGRSNYTTNNSYAHLYFAFGIMVLFCIGFVWKYIPETKNESLESAVKKYGVASGIIYAN